MSGTQDPYEVRPAEDRLHVQSAGPDTTSVTDTGIPPTGRHHDAPLGRTGADVTDEYNTTQVPGVAGQHDDTYFTTNGSNNRLFNAITDEPTIFIDSESGGVAIGGQSDLPLGHADMGDKIIGKTQKIMGKMTNNPELHEKGELRECGGKAAAHGLARAPHDQ